MYLSFLIGPQILASDGFSLVGSVDELVPVKLIITSASANIYKLPRELTKLLHAFHPVREFHLQMPLEVHTIRAWFLQRPTRNKYLIEESVR